MISTIVSPTAVNITGFRAVAQRRRSVLEWRTKSELRNLGFHIYREDATGHHRVTPSFIAGAALFAREAQPQHSAKTYRWIDPEETLRIRINVGRCGSQRHGPARPGVGGNFRRAGD